MQLNDRGVACQQGHRVSFAVQFLRAALVTLHAHDLDRHLTTGQLLTVQEDVSEATLSQRAHPLEAGNIRALHARNRRGH